MERKNGDTYEAVVLSVLHSEFSFSKTGESEVKIKRKLKMKKLGEYDQKRINMLREFKNTVQTSIGLQPDAAPAKFEESRYFVERHGKYGDYSDFDIPRMVVDMIRRYPQVPTQDIEWFVRYAVGVYYLL